MIKLQLNEIPIPGYTIKIEGRDKEVYKFALLVHLDQMLLHTRKYDTSVFLTQEEANCLSETVHQRMEQLGFKLELQDKNVQSE